MPEAPTISILTPVWNGLPYIKECVDSVLSQNYQDWEMIIADNASDDGTSEYLRSLTDPRIKVFRHEKNIGVYRNINFLFNKATSPIFMGLCADDYFYEGSLEKILSEWSEAGPEVGLITFNWMNRTQKHNKFDELSYELLPKVLGGIDSDFAFFLFGCFPGNFSEVSGRVALVAPEHYSYDTRFSADYDFWMRICRKMPIRISTADATYIRRHDRVAATYIITKGEYHEESFEVYRKIIDHLSPNSDRQKLIKFYNITIASFHLRSAIQSAFFGKFQALKSFMRLKSPIFWRFQFIRCLPFAMSEQLRFAVSRIVAREIWDSRK
ncbi:MAG: glycosyltransferase family 2 protein [Chryseolinea sp.]